MTTPRDEDALLSAFLADGMTVLPDRVIDSVLDEIHRTHQRTVFGPWRTRSTLRTAFGAVAVVALLVLGSTLYMSQRNQPAVGGPGPTAGASSSPGQSAVAVPSAQPTATLEPTPTETPGPTSTATFEPTQTPFAVQGGREWTVTVRNESSDPTTLFVAEEIQTGVGRQCGTVTPSVVPPNTTMKVTFLLPPKRVKTCWIWVNPVPGQGGSFFQTSDAPMKGEFVVTADGQTAWAGR